MKTWLGGRGESVQPQVSILVPVYNREAYLPACLESALAQTVSDLEIVVVDNASSDDTWEICRRFAARDSRIRIFRNPENLGPVRNWRRCFTEARGRYGKVLFSDDLMAPEFLAKALPYLEDPEIAFAFTSAEIAAEPGGGRIRYQWKGRSGKASSAEFIRDALRGRDVPVSPGAALFRLEDLRRNLRCSSPSNLAEDSAQHSLQHGAGPDLLLYLLTAAQYRFVAHVNETLAFFRWHDGSISQMRLARLGQYYTQAKIWFAAQPEGRSHRRAVMARAWLSRMKALTMKAST